MLDSTVNERSRRVEAGAVSTENRPISLSESGAADVVAELAEMGFSHTTAWLSSAVLYAVGGVVVAGLYLIDPQIYSIGAFFLGCFALIVALIQVLALRRFANTEWATHVRLAVGIGIYTVGAIMVKDTIVAMSLLPMLTVPTPCYLYGWRFALPYVTAVMLIICGALLLYAGGPAQTAHAIVSTFALAAIAASMILAKQRTRSLALLNRRLAYVDPLTGIANTRSLHEHIRAELARPSDQSEPFALFAIDLDNFKQVNDRFDHSRGDAVLRAVAGAIGDELEPGDLAARRGGDELSVLVPNAAERDLQALREKIAHAIVRARLETCPDVTPSGGVAYICARPTDDLGALMERADAALHDVKANSRNRRRGDLPEHPVTADPPRRRQDPYRGTAVGMDRASIGDTRDTGDRSGFTDRAVRWIGAFVRESDPVWLSAVAMLAPIAVIVAVVSIGGMVEPLTRRGGAAITVALIALTATCVWAGKRNASHRLIHGAALVAFGLIALAIALAGPSGAALLDLLPVVVVFSFLLFRARSALLYIVLGQTLFGVFAIGGGFAHGVARTAVTVVITGVVAGLVAKLRVVTVRFASTNRELSERDALTGLANLRALTQRIESATVRAAARGHRPVLIAIDLDKFKQVNDSYSHSIGDRVLIAVARAISESVGTGDLVARRGGDEFVVVHNDADSDLTEETAGRVADAIVRARRRICPDLPPTASIATMPWREGESYAEFLSSADRALHAAKLKSYGLDHLDATA